MGPHLLYCGDALDPASCAKFMGDKVADALFTDPPYKVKHISGFGRVKHREFVSGSDPKSDGDFGIFIEKFFRLAAANSKDGAIHVVAIDHRQLGAMLAAGAKVYGELKAICTRGQTQRGHGIALPAAHQVLPRLQARPRPAHQ